MDDLDNTETIKINYQNDVQQIKNEYDLLVRQTYKKLSHLKFYYHENTNLQKLINLTEEEQKAKDHLKNLKKLRNIQLRRAKTNYYNQLLQN